MAGAVAEAVGAAPASARVWVPAVTAPRPAPARRRRLRRRNRHLSAPVLRIRRKPSASAVAERRLLDRFRLDWRRGRSKGGRLVNGRWRRWRRSGWSRRRGRRSGEFGMLLEYFLFEVFGGNLIQRAGRDPGGGQCPVPSPWPKLVCCPSRASLKCRIYERAYFSVTSGPDCHTAFIGSNLKHKDFRRRRHNQPEIGVSPTFNVRRPASARAASIMAAA